MKLTASIFLTLAVAVNMAVAASVLRRASGDRHQYADKDDIQCGSAESHCIFLENAKSFGAADGMWIRCASVDDDGFGYGTCQFPAGASVTIGCIPDNGQSGVSVGFDEGSLGNQYTPFGYTVHAIWSSEKKNSHKTSGKNTFSQEKGDDLHVKCDKY